MHAHLRLALALALAVVALACRATVVAPGPTPTPAPASGTPTTDVAPLAPAAAPPEATRRQLSAEASFTLASGATMKVASGWWVEEQGGRLRSMAGPERDLTVWFASNTAATRAEAVAQAWQSVQPGFALAEAQAQEVPPRDGWDAVTQIAYVTPSASLQTVVAIALRKGTTWHVLMIDGATAALGRRGAQLGASLESYQAEGIQKESLAGRPARLGPAEMAAFATFVEEARQKAGVPGMAVAVVRSNEVLLSRGFGVAKLGKPGAVTDETPFMIGSTSKALTTMLMAVMVDQGALTWETPLTQLLPTFALGNAATTAAATLRHTVCACTGMPRQDLEFIFEYDGWTAEKRLASMRTMVPTTGFGETFQYSNLMVAVGGYAAGRQAGAKGGLDASYKRALERLVLKPFGLTQTSLAMATGKTAKAAAPHARGLDLTYARVPLEHERMVEAVAPAGAAWSTARDLGRLAQIELRRGLGADGKRLISEAALLERRKPQVKIGEHSAYGLGLFLNRSLGVTEVGHNGNTLGFTTSWFMVPEHDVGVVILSNGGGANSLREAVERRFLEIVLGASPRATTELDAALAQERTDMAEQQQRLVAPDRAWQDGLLGTYETVGLGKAVILRQGDRLYFDAGEWRSELTRLRGQDGSDQVLMVTPPLAGFTLERRPVQDGSGRSMLRLDAGQQVYDFVRVK